MTRVLSSPGGGGGVDMSGGVGGEKKDQESEVV